MIERTRYQHGALLLKIQHRLVWVDQGGRLRNDELGSPGAAPGGHGFEGVRGPFRQRGVIFLGDKARGDRAVAGGRSGRINADDEGRFGQLDDLIPFESRQPGGHGLGSRAEFPDRKAGDEELDTVWQRDGDEIVFLHTKACIGASQAIRRGIEGLPAQPFGLMDNGTAVRLLFCPMGQESGKGEAGHDVCLRLGFGATRCNFIIAPANRAASAPESSSF